MTLSMVEPSSRRSAWHRARLPTPDQASVFCLRVWFVADIYKQAILLQMLQAKQKVLTGNAIGQNVDKQGEILQWFNTTLDFLEKRFEMYLRLEH